MKRLCFIQLFVFFVIICMFATSSVAQDKVITIKVANWLPVGSSFDVILAGWAKDLEKRAGGKVKVNYYPGGTLVSAPQAYDSIAKGLVDVDQHVFGYSPGRFPFLSVLDLPVGWPQGCTMTTIMNKFYQRFKPKELDDVKVLWLHGGGRIYLHTKTKPVRNLEDIKGLKIRSYGSNAKFVGLFGAAPVAMSMAEVYDALSRGVVDGALIDYGSLRTFKTGELVKYSTENHGTAPIASFVVAMNKKKFNSLPPDIKAIIEKLSEEYIEKSGKMWADYAAEGKAWLTQKGVQFIPLSKEEDAAWYERGGKPLIQEYIREMRAAGLPGEEAVKFLQDTFKEYKK